MGKTLQRFLVSVVLKYNFSIKVFDSFSYHKMLLKHLQNLLKTMVSVAHKYSANEALATFVLATDSESNDSFGDESSLEPSDRYDSEKQPWFCGTELDEIQEND